MDYNPSKRELKLSKELNNLDKFVIDFTKILKKYVIVSGYVSILLGRSRATEDVDLLVPAMSIEEFSRIWNESIKNGFWCINTSKINEAFKMLKEHAIRFAKKEMPVPNIEFKIIKTELDEFSYENKIKVIINSTILYVSPFELQIAYKLFLGSDKDIEDARHLYQLLKDKINKEELITFTDKLKVKDKLRLLE